MPHTNGSRPPFKAGDLLFFSGRGWLAWGIKRGTLPWLGWSHVGLVVSFTKPSPMATYLGTCDETTYLVDATTLDNEPCVITGKTSGCRARSIPWRIKAYQDDGGEVYHFPIKHSLDASVRRTLEHYARKQLGKEYDWLGAWRCRTTPIAMLFRWLFPDNRAALYCAENSADMLDFIEAIECEYPGDHSPNSLAELVTDQDTHGPAWRCE